MQMDTRSNTMIMRQDAYHVHFEVSVSQSSFTAYLNYKCDGLVVKDVLIYTL
jgi:hypothetical protein